MGERGVKTGKVEARGKRQEERGKKKEERGKGKMERDSERTKDFEKQEREDTFATIQESRGSQ